jgi:tryptophan synthase alpha chain
MSALREAFARAAGQGRPALVCYVMGGDPSIAATEELLSAIDSAGADIIELGIPFSDPIADGPAIQAAGTRALQAGTTLTSLLAMTARLRGKLRAPLVMMGYVNPILSYRFDRFARDAAAAGIVGVIVPDVPFEEAGELRTALEAAGIDLVPLVAPTSDVARMKAIAAGAKGFVYYVSVTGVTGARAALPPDTTSRIAELRKVSPAPVAVGFGISRPEQARGLRGVADGVVVGSALVQANHGGGASAVTELVRGLAAALRS